MSTFPSFDSVFPQMNMDTGLYYWNYPSAFQSTTALPFDMATSGMMTYMPEPLFSPVSIENENGVDQEKERPTSSGLEKIIGHSMFIGEQQSFDCAGHPIEYSKECFQAPSTSHIDFGYFPSPSSSSCPTPVPEQFTVIPPRDNHILGADLFNLDAQNLVNCPSQADSLCSPMWTTAPLSHAELTFAPSLPTTPRPPQTPILIALLNAPPLNSTTLVSPQENYYDDMRTITASASPVDSPLDSPSVSRPSSVESTSDSGDSIEMEKTTSTQSTVTIRSASTSSPLAASTKQSNGSLTLWAFIASIALNPAKKGIVAWTGEGYQFRIVNPELFCKAWSRHQGRHDTTPWSSVQRAIRLSYGKGKRVGMIVNDLQPRRDYTWTFVKELPQVLIIPKGALDDYIYAHNEKGPLTTGRVPLTRTLHPYVYSTVFPLKSSLDYNVETLYPCDSLVDIVRKASMSLPLIPSIYGKSIFNSYEQNSPGPIYGYSVIENPGNPHGLYKPY